MAEQFSAWTEWTGGADGEGHVENSSGTVDLDYGLGEQFGGAGSGDTTPEELMVASLSMCYALTLAALAGQSGLELESCRVEARTEMVKDPEGGYQVENVHRDVSVTIAGEDQRGLAEKLIGKADELCIMSKVARRPTDLSMDTELNTGG